MSHSKGKRPSEVVDLTFSDDENENLPPAKAPKLNDRATGLSDRVNAQWPSSHSSASFTGSQPSSQVRDSWSSSSRQAPSSQTLASSQTSTANGKGAVGEIDLTQDDDDDNSHENYQLYGVLDTKIVGIQYYKGRANPGERVLIIREPGNPYDRNAIRVDNVMGTQFGHIGRKFAAKLAPFLDSGALLAEGILSGRAGPFDCPIDLNLYGTSDPVAADALKKDMQAAKLPVSSLIQAERQRKKDEAEKAKRLKAAKNGGTRNGVGGLQFDQATGKYANLGMPGEGEASMSMDDIIAQSESFDPREVGEVADKFGSGEDVLSKLPLAQQPKTLRTKLLPYQLQGLQWMLDHESPEMKSSGEVCQLWKREPRGFYTNIATSFSQDAMPKLASGGILADDMGLGKTIQVISLIVSQKEKTSGPTLIVSPLSVMSNWSGQMAAHVQEKYALKVLIYHGEGRGVSSKAELNKYDVVITTYNTMGLEYFPNGRKTPVSLPQSKGLFSIDWRRIVLDEGHVLRNPKAKMSLAAHALQATSRWVLSGTPIVNNLKDLYSHVRFVRLTGGLEQFEFFNGTLIRPLKQGNQAAKTLLQALMASICLRRMKSMKHIDLGLPPLSSHKYPIKFLGHERKKYDAFEAEAKGLLLQVQEKRTQSGMSTYSHLLEVLLRMRQTCNHWKLCGDRVSKLLAFIEQNKVIDTTNVENRRAMQEVLHLRIEAQEDCSVCLETLNQHDPVITHCGHAYGRDCIKQVMRVQGKCPLCRAELKDSETCLVEPAADLGEEDGEAVDVDETSSKIEALIQILKASAKKPKTKTVVFSQWTSFLDIVEKQLAKHGFRFTRLDGKMAVSKRDDAISSLDNDPECTIMLASLAVCGVGLNLVSANQVILMDSWWAPAIEDQAIDRVHRLGQTQPTIVFRLVMEGSVEEKVLEIQKTKRELAATAFREDGSKRGQERVGRLNDLQTLLSR